ncbi:iron ABC transporter permease [Corynebacterium sp. CCM 9185]|uniref:Iron ABC transporter permease n=1 Tax=Corynebacterium marambiense TaxID=2765364 RepID=A0ABS0VSU3_9CORY|nr:iron ABC transporter permease [Corynebacterium marambiense]MBI8999845.1 iron ABC transporter permease [Corynebacterium marambiense]MCK7662684.1 iron ABC transporter permease [Corynebacterium marambiense]MCX7543695.1 iron ABC transporter permease [Corynebacterium marambiense]
MYRSRRRIGFLVSAALLFVLIIASLMIGSNPIPVSHVLHLLISPDTSFESTVIHEQRVPRTIVVIIVAAALGCAGALMQSLTRNPLADPGVLGVNAGASLAVVLAVAVAGITSIWFYLWFAFIGAALAAVVVYVLGGAGRSAPTPVRLALAGVAVTMAVSSIVQVVILSNRHAFNEFRFWATGSVEGRGWPVLIAVSGFIIIGLLLAFATAPSLNALALGDEEGRSLGVRVGLIRTLVMIAVTLLAGAATAAVGPIMFIGLGVPYIARFICGPDQRWVLPFSALSAPVVLLTADIIARIIMAPQELQTGIVTTILGGPFFIAIVRRRRIESL